MKAALAVSLLGLLPFAGFAAKRQVVSLDGTWRIAEGGLEAVPAAFERDVPVPGLADMAVPPFVEPGPTVASRKDQVPNKDPRRDAFWYRRTFRLDGPVPAVAQIKVRKAMFGTRVILNGRTLGDHRPCFTPGYFDARPALRVGENELLIRVGADRRAVGAGIPSGFDFEKARYIPGIFDSVELILSGTPHFTQVQAAPDLAGRAVRVQAVLRNGGAAAAGAGATFVVREAESGREAGRADAPAVQLAPGAETTVDVRVAIADCRPWSPDDPFLYRLEAEATADRVEVRFGMREFRFDPKNCRATLNGKPFRLRGSNITLYRFFEDAGRGDLPWRDDWVKLLHRRVKEMNWNSLRYCIGFPPEAWYDAADEAGILIQDEFPIWSHLPDVTHAELAAEYAEWLRERWNHPCVVIWDACNETRSTETGEAIREVRRLDLSGRPWDNGYNVPQEPGDVYESHPYHFKGEGRLRDLAAATTIPKGSKRHNEGGHAAVINEYGWHWVNRDGTPTTLTRKLYDEVLGTNATPAQRFRMQALWLAADTEFWRMHRKAAGVLHFTTLGYARPDGQTSDHWTPGGLASLEWEPEFRQYVRDAFAPVGVALDFWADRVETSAAARVTVRLVNDLDVPWRGQVALRVSRPGAPKAFLEVRQVAEMPAYGETSAAFDLYWPEVAGPCTMEAEIRGAGGAAVRSVREFDVAAGLK